MTKLVYDGTFEGLVTVMFEVYERKLVEFTVQQYPVDVTALFEDVIHVHANEDRAKRVLDGLYKRLSPRAVERLYIVNLSEMENRANVVAGYIKHVFDSPVNIEDDFSNRHVLATGEMVMKMRRERHRMEAFIRFEKLQDGTYYSAIEPDFNVLPLLIKHFKDRYADQKWMIYDLCRRYGIYYDMHDVEYITLEFSEVKSAERDAEDAWVEKRAYQDLWKSYYKNVNIPARKNTKLHLRHIPRRYWRFLTEKF